MSEQRKVKKVSDSQAEQVKIVLYHHTTSTGRLHGGQLVQWIDIVASVVARRHAGCDVTTAAIENLSFLAPAYVGDTVVLQGRLTYVGKTSMRVRVDTYNEPKHGERILVNRAYLVMVALDENGNPCAIPGLELVNDEEQQEWDAAVQLQKARQ